MVCLGRCSEDTGFLHCATGSGGLPSASSTRCKPKAAASTSLGKRPRGDLGRGRKMWRQGARYEGNLQLIAQASQKASGRLGPSSGACGDEGSTVVSTMAENDRLGEEGGCVRNSRGSCLVLAQTGGEMFGVPTNLLDNEPIFEGCMRTHVRLLSSQRLDLAPSVRPCCA
jgi:hypothetical protein